MVIAVAAWDTALFQFCNQTLRFQALDVLMPLASQAWPLWALAALGALWAARRYGCKLALLSLLAIGLAAGAADLGANLAKSQTGRLRPLQSLGATWFHEDGQWRQRPLDFAPQTGRGASFFSAHAATTMAVALTAAVAWPPLRPWVLALPLVVGYSRIYLGKHFPTDVVAGWLWGALVGLAIWAAWRRSALRWRVQS